VSQDDLEGRVNALETTVDGIQQALREDFGDGQGR